MSKKFDIFFFSGTHWDREWYQSFQGFRYRLVKMMDGLVDGLKSLDNFNVFHLDGQTIVLEDYTQIKPEKAAELKELIENNKLKVGPWFVMPDEFNLSGESLIRNLMMGHELSKKWGGKPWKFGYICDIFGHIAQMPQIFNGFDIKYSYQSRGGVQLDAPPYFIWQSPDGSETIAFHPGLGNDYGEFCHKIHFVLNDNPDADVKELIKEYVDELLKHDGTDIPVYFIADAADHRPLYTETVKYLEILEELYPEANIHHVDLIEAGRMLDGYRGKMNVMKGELNLTTKAENSTMPLITNTLSSYYPLKKANDECQNELEKVIEPFLALSKISGSPMERNYVRLAYKYLVQNHPHDSICGCSIDQVHKDMEYRFDQVKGICYELRNDYIKSKGRAFLDGTDKETDAILTLYNPLPFDRDEVVTVDLNMKENYSSQYAEPFGYEFINSFRILDHEGNEIPYQVISIKRGQMVRRVEHLVDINDIHTVTFKAFIPAGGKSEYRIVPCEVPSRYLSHMTSGTDYMENEHIRVKLSPWGTISITDKKTGKVYDNQLALIDDTEIGDGWFHAASKEDRAVISSFGNCHVEKIQSGVSRCMFRIVKELKLPAENVISRPSQIRSSNYDICTAVFDIGLSENNRFVDVKLTFDNRVRDHRLRLVMPTYTDCEKYFAGQAFYCCEREAGIDYSTQNWKEHEQYEKSMNGIVGRRDSKGNGLAFISANGLHECGSTKDENSTLYVTLLRGFRKTSRTNGETRCQLLGEHEYSFLLAPIDKNVSYKELVNIQDRQAVGVISTYAEVMKDSPTASPESNFRLEGDNICLSILKCAEHEENAYVVRVWNASGKASKAILQFENNITSAVEVNLNEEVKDEVKVSLDKNKATFNVAPWKIVSVMVKF